MNWRVPTTIGAQLAGLAWRLVLYVALLIVGVRGSSMFVKTVLHRLGVHFSHQDGARPVESLILSQLVILMAAVVATAVLGRTDRESRRPCYR